MTKATLVLNTVLRIIEYFQVDGKVNLRFHCENADTGVYMRNISI